MATITTAETFDALWQKSTADLSDSSIWDAKYHTLGSSVPANAGMFGLTIIDWDKNGTTHTFSIGQPYNKDITVTLVYLA